MHSIQNVPNEGASVRVSATSFISDPITLQQQNKSLNGFQFNWIFSLSFFVRSNETCYQKAVHQTNRSNNVSFTLRNYYYSHAHVWHCVLWRRIYMSTLGADTCTDTIHQFGHEI